MKWTKTFIQTLREDPQDAEIDSHKLLVRAGICRKTASGLFTFMPLGMRTLRKIEVMFGVNDSECLVKLSLVMDLLITEAVVKIMAGYQKCGHKNK